MRFEKLPVEKIRKYHHNRHIHVHQQQRRSFFQFCRSEKDVEQYRDKFLWRIADEDDLESAPSSVEDDEPDESDVRDWPNNNENIHNQLRLWRANKMERLNRVTRQRRAWARFSRQLYLARLLDTWKTKQNRKLKIKPPSSPPPERNKSLSDSDGQKRKDRKRNKRKKQEMKSKCLC